LNFVK